MRKSAKDKRNYEATVIYPVLNLNQWRRQYVKKKKKTSQAPVAHTCNPTSQDHG
jgi:hypothetical protein